MTWSPPPGSRPRSPKGSRIASSSSSTIARTLPSTRTPRNSTSAPWNSCSVTPDRQGQRSLGADVVIVLLDHVHRRLFRGGPACVVPDVGRAQSGLLVGVGTFVLDHQPARPRIGAVIDQQPVAVLD